MCGTQKYPITHTMDGCWWVSKANIFKGKSAPKLELPEGLQCMWGGGVQTKRNTHVKDMLIAIFRNNIHSWSSCPSNCIWNFEITNITKQYGFSSCQYQLHYCTRHASSM